MATLTLETLKTEAIAFGKYQSGILEPSLFGVTDGKRIGTYIEHTFKEYLGGYEFEPGNSALGIDLPGLNVDIKTTSLNGPQSSCPFRDARQKIYGLGYDLLVFVYDKIDCIESKASRLDICQTHFIASEETADYTITYDLRNMIQNGASLCDVAAYLQHRNIPMSDYKSLAAEIIDNPPPQGRLTVSNALQWRVGFGRIT